MIGQLNDLYAHHCDNCGGSLIVEDLADDKDDWQAIYQQIAEDLLNGADYKVNADLHLKTAKKLTEAIDKGLSSVEYGDKTNALKEALKRNIYPFSVAKSFTQMLYYRKSMVNEKGEIRSYDNFVKHIADSGEVFNSTFLRAEYEHAYYSTIMADKWERFSADDYLQYSTVGDRNVRPSHAILDKYTAPKSDNFWKKNYPPNGWNCRCTVIPGKANHQNRLTPQEAGRQLKDENKETPFYGNVGETKLIFHNKHPYFIDSKGKETNLSWEQYGLPNLDTIRTNELPEFSVKTKEEFFEWWNKQTKIKNSDDIVLKDVLGNEITFTSADKGKDFKNHILRKSTDKRFEYASELDSVIKHPNEVWINPNDKNTISYLKFFENGTLRVVVNEHGKGETMYLIDKDNPSEKNKIGESRKGILLYK